jgi:hypothetical protein
MLHNAGGADGFTTIRLDTQQHLEFGIHCDQMARGTAMVGVCCCSAMLELGFYVDLRLKGASLRYR